MKKTYNKLSSELLLLESEGSFMACSVRLKAQFMVEDYKDFEFSTGDGTTSNQWNVGFDD